MIPKEQAERLKEELIAALQEDAYNVDRLLRRLDTLSREAGVGAHAALLSVLTHLPFEESEAREHWDAILAHRHEMSLALARDIGIRVAVLDYFLNVNKRLTRPALIDLAVEETNRRAEGLYPVTGLATDRAFRMSDRKQNAHADDCLTSCSVLNPNPLGWSLVPKPHAPHEFT